MQRPIKCILGQSRRHLSDISVTWQPSGNWSVKLLVYSVHCRRDAGSKSSSLIFLLQSRKNVFFWKTLSRMSANYSISQWKRLHQQTKQLEFIWWYLTLYALICLPFWQWPSSNKITFYLLCKYLHQLDNGQQANNPLHPQFWNA